MVMNWGENDGDKYPLGIEVSGSKEGEKEMFTGAIDRQYIVMQIFLEIFT